MSEVIKLTKDEALKTFNIKENTLYKWMKQGKVKYEQHKRTRIITLTKEEFNQILQEQQLYQQTRSEPQNNQSAVEDDQIVYNATIVDDNIPSNSMGEDNQNLSNLIDLIKEMKTELVEKAEIAGQVKLLTVDNDLYKNEYFKLRQEVEMLTERNKQQEELIKDLEANQKQSWLTMPLSDLVKKL